MHFIPLCRGVMTKSGFNAGLEKTWVFQKKKSNSPGFICFLGFYFYFLDFFGILIFMGVNWGFLKLI